MKRKLVILTVLLILSAAAFFLYNYRFHYFRPGYHSHLYTPEKYHRLKSSLSTQRAKLNKLYTAAGEASKKQLLRQAEAQFIQLVKDSLMPYWYGTDWDFNGTTEVPGKGSIACGYFVTTLLRDAGVNLDRSALAQCASEEMIKTLVPEKSIQRFSKTSINDFVKAVQAMGDGIYVTGLDNHTGFIVCIDNKVQFIHSGGGFPSQVVVQDAVEAKMLVSSKYRVLAKLSSNEAFLGKWMKGEKFRKRS